MTDMRRITTNDGEAIYVPPETTVPVIDRIKAAKATHFHEFVYTGNSRNGDNAGNYDDLDAFWTESGLELRDELELGIGPYDDSATLRESLYYETGIYTFEHRGKRIRYHVQMRKAEKGNPQFGYHVALDLRCCGLIDQPRQIAQIRGINTRQLRVNSGVRIWVTNGTPAAEIASLKDAYATTFHEFVPDEGLKRGDYSSLRSCFANAGLGKDEGNWLREQLRMETGTHTLTTQRGEIRYHTQFIESFRFDDEAGTHTIIALRRIAKAS